MQEKEIIINHKKLFYRTIGSGPPVVLLHGFGEDGMVWSKQFTALQGYQLIIPDLPGSGRSEMIDDMTMDGLARSIYDLLRFTGIDRCVMIGHSMGGYVMLAFAEKYPERLSGFGLFHSTAYADSEEKKETRRKGIQFIQTNGAFEFLKATIPNLYSSLTRAENPAIIEEQIAGSHNFSGAALVSYYEAMINRPDRTEVLRFSKNPVLFILGRYDNAVPLQDGLKLCQLPDLSYIHILEAAGHMGMKEATDNANSILANYLHNTYHQAR